MNYHFRRTLSCALATLLLVCALSVPASAATFTDVPSDSWAAADISRCVELGIFQGETATTFGMGHEMTRSSFAVVLCRLFGWELITPEKPSFVDVPASERYYSAVETALAHGALTLHREDFRPADSLTREEMTVILMRALGYETLAGLAVELPMPFKDVTTNAGYIALAYQLGVINGTTADAFAPAKAATREQVAVTLMRIYDNLHRKTPGAIGVASGEEPGDWTGYEAVAITGGRLSYGGSAQVTRPEESREKQMVKAAHDAGAKALLHVTGTSSSLQGKRLDMASTLAAAVQDGGYDGVYLNFAGLNNNSRATLTALVKEVKARLGDKLVYLVVDAPSWRGREYKAYDYAALGMAADRLVLRITPYEERLTGGFIAAPMEPLEEVYYALKTLKDSVPGEKLCLQLTTTGRLHKSTSQKGLSVSAAEVSAMLADEVNTRAYYDERYGCAYLIQKDAGNFNAVWYLDGEGVAARANLCAFFGASEVCLSDLDSVSPEVRGSLQ